MKIVPIILIAKLILEQQRFMVDIAVKIDFFYAKINQKWDISNENLVSQNSLVRFCTVVVL